MQHCGEHVRMLHDQGVGAMVQPYVKEVDAMGERALTFFNGEFSHAMHKEAVLQQALVRIASRWSRRSN